MFYVYLIQNQNKENYIGSTNDLRRRLDEHNSNKSTYTKNKQWKLVYYEAFLEEKDARLRESKLKAHGYSKRHLFQRLQHSLKAII